MEEGEVQGGVKVEEVQGVEGVEREEGREVEGVEVHGVPPGVEV